MFTEKLQTLKEMRKMQERYIALEEIQEEARGRGVHEASATIRATPGNTPRRLEKRPDPPPRGNGKKEWIAKGKKPRHEPRAYTPLNAPLEEIFKEVEKRNDIIYPASRGVQFEETKDHPGYRHYHQYRGHSTNNCREVKDIVQHLIRDRYLRQFVRQAPQATTAPDAPVHQCSQDPADGTLDDATHFLSAKDVPMNGQVHSDPLVITLLIEEWGVRRILVDIGSSVEVLFYDTFKRMELSDDILVPSTYRIYGFNVTVTILKGELNLRVSDGGGYLDTLTTFCVVDVASPYEAIIGIPCIASIKGVASAYHQRLRFPTYKGIAEVVGDSQEARKCMQIDIQIKEERRAH
ncbi:uncharacterized protein LOC113295731 [Papaver somniferum]|uniref:uncharacterized protein LOC113295731 n=1 Tax=Papaver somniferum TaxID=3469 RepID=UPI000E6FB9A4|nr:uncharacterized protein LOC113295731 [Papaver somniferum]